MERIEEETASVTMKVLSASASFLASNVFMAETIGGIYAILNVTTAAGLVTSSAYVTLTGSGLTTSGYFGYLILVKGKTTKEAFSESLDQGKVCFRSLTSLFFRRHRS